MKLLSFLKRNWIWLTIILVILIFVGLSVSKARKAKNQYSTDIVKRETVADTVSETGNIVAEGQANIYSPIEGIVETSFVKNGDSVSENQKLFLVKSTATDQDKAASYSAYLTAQNNVTLAEQSKRTLEIQLQTAQKQLVDAQADLQIVVKSTYLGELNPATSNKYSPSDMESAKAAVAIAQSTLTAAEQKVDEADQAIGAAQGAEESALIALNAKSSVLVKAPTSGLVSNLSIFIGDRVNTSSLSSAPALVIAKSNNPVFKAQINEIDILKLKVGQTGIATIDAAKNQKFNTKVSKIDDIGTNTSGVITYNVYFEFETADAALKSGMSGNISVETEKHENVLTVANAAVKPYQDGKAVQVIDPTLPKKKNLPQLKYIPVKTGIKTSDRTEIIEGLSEGMEVIINNTSNQFKSNLFGG